MPPRVKKTPAPGPRRNVKTVKKIVKRPVPSLPKVEEAPEKVKEAQVKVEEAPAKVEEVPAPSPSPKAEEAPASSQKVEEAPSPPKKVQEEVEAKADVEEVEDAETDEDPEDEPKLEDNGSIEEKKEDEVKESADEYERGERLDLEDNDYEAEEYGAVDYDEKEIEQEDVEEVQEEGDDVDEEVEEGDAGEEEEVDMVEEEIEEVQEEMEVEEDEELGGNNEEHADMVDDEDKEQHEVANERRKRKEFEIFVGGLDREASEDDLKKVFSEVGEISEVRLMMDPQTKKNKGFAFLRFATVEQAKRAVAELKHPVVNGKKCGVTPSQDTDTLFIGNICKTWTKEALKDKLKHYKVENIDDITLVEDSNNEGRNRGFAFLEFSSRSDAMDAYKRLQKKGVMFGMDRPAKVSFADSFIDPGDEIMSQVKTVFVDSLPPSWDEDRVRGLLKKYGAIEKIQLARNMPSAKRKDFGFVTFDSHDAAVTCAKNINNAELGEGDHKAKVRARLSRPLRGGKGKNSGRGELRSRHTSGRSSRRPFARPMPRAVPRATPRSAPRSLPRAVPRPVSRAAPSRGARGVGARSPPDIDRGLKRSIAVRDRRAPIPMPVRSRPLPPASRSYERRMPVPSYPKSSIKKDYDRRDELPPRSRPAADYGSRVVSDRRTSYRDQFAARGSGYSEFPRSTSRTVARRDYEDDGYEQRYNRSPLGYRDGRSRDYDSGSKRPYSAVDDVPPRYADAGERHARTRYDYDLGGSGSHYGDAYSDRLGRSNLGYSTSKSSIPSQDPRGLYSSRQGVTYGGGSFSGADGGGVYSSSFSSDYASRDVGGGSYSSLYSSRGIGGSSYIGSGGSGSYY